VKELEKARLKQARESLDEAQALLTERMDTGLVLTNLFYAFYYSILALMNEGQTPTTMQSVTLGLFEQQFIKTGKLPKRFRDAIQRVFDSKPKCSGEKTPVSADEVNTLLDRAREFINDVEELL
jgi:HEPN domain.